MSPPDSTISYRGIVNGAIVVGGVLAFSGATRPVVESHLGLMMGGDL